MNILNRVSPMALVVFPLIAACSDPDPQPQPESAKSSPTTTATDYGPSGAPSREITAERVAGLRVEGTNCREIGVENAPIAAAHLDDPMRQQTAGESELAAYFPDGSSKPSLGTALATIVGKQSTGELLGNHHFLYGDGTLRTKNDVITITPTDDKCVVDAKVKLFFVDGTGAFAGLSGEGVAEGRLDFCGAVGRVKIYARLCEVAK
jgi:hypothetical protein